MAAKRALWISRGWTRSPNSTSGDCQRRHQQGVNGYPAQWVRRLTQPIGVQGFDEQRGGDVAAGDDRLPGGEGLLDRHVLQTGLLSGAGGGGVVVARIRAR